MKWLKKTTYAAIDNWEIGCGKDWRMTVRIFRVSQGGWRKFQFDSKIQFDNKMNTPGGKENEDS
jgi:hypothetical protein